MIALDILWHVLNLFVLPLGLGALAAAMAKLLWRGDLKGVAWTRMALWAGLASSATTVAALVSTGRDGRMASYGAMVVACALAIWVVGFLRPRKG